MEIYGDRNSRGRPITFLDFGNKDILKQRKQQELNQDYLKFKAIDEEKFRNRFADRKATGSQIAGEPNTFDTGGRLIKSSDGMTQAHQPSSPSPVEVIMAKLDYLQESIQSLRGSDTNTIMGTDRARFLARNTPNTITYQTVLMGEAETRLRQLESIVASLQQPNDLKTDPGSPKIDSEEATKDLETNVVTQSPYDRDTMSKGRFIHLHGSANSRERLRQRERENYAIELQKQIEDTQRMRYLQHQKEAADDKKKLEEMKSHDTLGQKRNSVHLEPVVSKDNASTNATPGSKETPANHTRGGNGIFGQPLTESQKQANSKYREELMVQIEERKKREDDLKRREKEEEDRQTAWYEAEEKRKAEAQKFTGVQKTLVEPPKAPTEPRESATDTRKHSIGLQATLEICSPQKRPRPTRVIRKMLPNKAADKKALNFEELIVRLNQLKLELSSEKVRLQESDSLSAKNVQIYDPRTIYLPMRNTVLRDSFLGRPVKVRRSVVYPTAKSADTPIRRRVPAELPGAQESLDVDRRCSLESSQIQSNSHFLPSNEVPRTPSLGSLNLDEMNRRNEQRLRYLTFGEQADGDEYEDNTVDSESIYRNEEPILRDFMRVEGARRKFKW